MREKAIIISAPSGAGKTSIVRHLLEVMPQLGFSVSACSRPMRAGEREGRDYYFLSPGTFREMIAGDAFVEWQEVYPGSYYGTTKAELQRIWALGKVPVFDVDVKGGVNLKKYFGSRALSIFISPPSLEIMHQRLRDRGTETAESLEKRIGKSAFEMQFSTEFDTIVVNDRLEEARREVQTLIGQFLDVNPAGG